MAEMVKVPIQEMQATIQTYMSSKQELQNAYNEVRSAVTATEATWQGDAANTFRNSFSTMYGNIEKTEAKMQNAIKDLNAVVDAFMEAENKINTTAGGLDKGTSPFFS